MSAKLQLALRYADAGFSVIPLRGKICPIKWTDYQVEPAEYGRIHAWHQAGVLQNIGIVCGSVSGNLAVIDLDGLEAVREFYQTFPHLVETYRVNTGSGKGQHLYFLADELPNTTRTKGFELRCDGCYVVAPPSVHPVTEQHYLQLFGWSELHQVRRVHDLNEVQMWIAGKVKTKQQLLADEGAQTPIRDASAYGLAALRNACRKVASASAGGTNNELNRQAFKMGFLVERGHLSYHQVVSDLETAAGGLSERDGDRATLMTIRSGLQSGIDRCRNERRG